MKQPRISHSMNEVYEQEHFVQFYQGEDRLLGDLSCFIGAGLVNGDPCIVIATAEHRRALEERLTSKGHDVAAALSSNRYISLEARDTLAAFMEDGLPNKQLFKQVVGKTLKESRVEGKVIRAFGEMVSLLWSQDNQAGAIMLEQLWNDIAREYSFTLFCGYPLHYFENIAQTQTMHDISLLHSSAIIPEPVTALDVG